MGKIKSASLFPKSSACPEALKCVGIVRGNLKQAYNVKTHTAAKNILLANSNLLSSGESESFILGLVSTYKMFVYESGYCMAHTVQQLCNVAGIVFRWPNLAQKLNL